MNSCVLGFNGERLDPISGHYHLGNGYRAYNPVLMRFTCPDSWSPFGDGGINPYAYCAGDPVNRADPSGHHSFWGWFGIAAGVALGVLLTPVSGGSSLAVALSAISVTMAVASTGLAVAQQFVEESDPKAGAALGWAALGTGIASGLSSGVLSKVAPEAKSLAGLLKGTSNRPFGGLMMEGQNAGKAGSGSIWRNIRQRLPLLQRRSVFSEGSEAILYKKGNVLIKEYKNSNITLSHLENETSIFNKIYSTDMAKVKPPRSILMPVIEGTPISSGNILSELTRENAQSLIESMDRIHNMRVLHGDINDGNILFKKATNEFNFVDFSASSLNSSGAEIRAEKNYLRWKIQQWPKYSDEWGNLI